MKLLRISITITLSCLCLMAAAPNETGRVVATIPAEWSGKVTEAAQLPIEKNAWRTHIPS